jgi:hypothetical protein
MSTDTLTERPAPDMPEGTPRTVRLGSFLVTGQIVDPEGPDTSFHLAAIGADDGPFAGQPATVSAMTAPKDTDALARAEVLLAKRKHLTHPTLVPILETGKNGTVLFWAEAMPDGVSLETGPDQVPWAIGPVRDLVMALAGGLQIAHDLGLSHGAIDADSVLRANGGGYLLAGLGLGGGGAAKDQADLATLAMGLLAGRPWVEGATPGNRADVVRAFLSDQTQRIASVFARATDTDPSARFGSVAEFAGDFTQAVLQSADDLVHGAFEAISSKSPELAQLLAQRAAAYDSTNESLALLNLQLRGNSPFTAPPQLGAEVPAAHVAPGPTFPGPAPLVDLGTAPLIPPSLLPEELTRGLPEEFLRTIAPQFEIKTNTKPRMNPMFVLIVGCVGIAFLLALAGVGMFVLGGS